MGAVEPWRTSCIRGEVEKDDVKAEFNKAGFRVWVRDQAHL